MDQFDRLFSAWRTIRCGSREAIDALVLPAHTAPSAELATFLAGWRGAHYWADRSAGHLVLIRSLERDVPVRWITHVLLFLLTLVFSLAAGAAMAGVWYPVDNPGFLVGLGRDLVDFVRGVVAGDWKLFLAGWSFAVPAIGILLIHELGHYWAARRYLIDASPPYFLPVPPSISPIGSFGAFIRVQSPVIDRRQLADVGAAGPLAGFVVAVGVMIWGYLTSERVAWEPGLAKSYVVFAGQLIRLGDSLLTYWLREWLLPGGTAVHLSLPAFAGWVGCFLTGLNLLPLSQLDGGHIAYGYLGKRQHWLAIVTVAALLFLSQYSFSWLIWVVMAFAIGGGRLSHPPVVVPDRPIPPRRAWVGVACLIVFVITFVPIPLVL
ncbi:MAG: site-2 protease family protein [Gemmatimonadales bacterium]|nr:site-2 protease family protein [Gemmatimonadales bacterium]